MLHFATYFDKNYLTRGLVLYHSLKEHCIFFSLHLLCLDEFTHAYFQKHSNLFPEVKPFLLSELEEKDTLLASSKSTRSKIEYYFTISPCLPYYLLKQYHLPHICTLDADILFLSDPSPLFEDLNRYSVIITPHKFSKELLPKQKFGLYNVSFQVFKNDETGLNCLSTWRQQCVDWCGDTFDERNQRYADQKYLDAWHSLFPGKIKDLNDEVSGLAPWNINSFEISRHKNQYFSNGKKIIFYHFHHYKFFSSRIAFNGFHSYQIRAYKRLNDLYLVYWNKILEQAKLVNISGDAPIRYYNSNKLPSNIYYEKTFYLRLSKSLAFALNFNWLSSIVDKFRRTKHNSS